MANFSTDATVTLNVNGSEARKTLSLLQTEAKRLDAEMKKAAQAGDKIKMKSLQSELNRTRSLMDRMQSSGRSAEQVLRRLDTATPRELNKALRTMRTQLNGIQRGSAAWNAQVERIRAVKAELDKVNVSMKAQEHQASRIGGVFKNIGLMLVGGTATITGAIAEMRKSVESFKARDTEEANTRKFTGLDVAGVKNLNKELAKIDTRSTREQLLQLAQEAGRLGKTSIDDLTGFVRGADKVNVALADLGGEAVITLAKLNGIFGIEQQYGTEEALMKTGSVINVLSQNCAASKPYLAEFASRLGGIGAQSGMTMQQIIAFAAVLDTQNLAVEAAGTAMGQLIMKIYKDPQKIAVAAGLDVQKFARTVKTDMNGALIMLFEHLKGVGGMEKLATVFGDMKTDGARAVPVLSALAGHIDELKRQQEVANRAFSEGTSVSNEFAIQNDTAAAKVDKARNRINELRVELGEKLFPVMGTLNRPTILLLQGLNSLVSFIITYRQQLVTLIATVTAYNAVMLLSAARAKAAAAAHMLLAASTKGINALGAAFTTMGNLGRVGFIALTRGASSASAAMRLLNVSLTAVPWLKIAATVGAVVAAIVSFRTRTDEVTKAQKEAAEAAGALHSQLDTERRDIDLLFNRLRYAKKGTQEYEEAKQAIINQYGGYLKGLGMEIESLGNVEAAYRAITRAANESARARGLAEANKKADDTRNEIWETTGADLRKGLQDLRIGDNGRRLTSREVTEWMQKLGDQIMNGGIDEDTRRWLRTAGIYRSKAGTWQSFSRGNTEGSSDLADALNKRERAQQAWTVSRRLNDQNFSTTEMKLRTLDTGGLNDAMGRLTAMKGARKFGEIHLANGETLFVENGTDADAFIEKILDFLSDDSGGFRNPQTPDVTAGIVPDTTTIPDSGDGGKKGDKFKADKEWRELEEAKALLAKETGQIIDSEGRKHLYTLADYTTRMEEIEQEFYARQLRHTDLTEKERTVIEAQQQEARNKQADRHNSLVLEDENELYGLQLSQLKQSFIDGRISTEAYHRELENMEAEHLRIMAELSDESTEEGKASRQKYQDYLLKLAEKRQKETEDRATAKENYARKYFGTPTAEDNAGYTTAMGVLTEVYNDEISKAAGNKEKLLQIERAFQAAKLAIAQQYNQQAGEGAQSAYAMAAQSQLDWLNGEGGQALAGALNFITNDVGALFSQLSAGIQADLEIQLAAIEKRYSREIQYAEGNNAKIKRLEAAKEKEQAKTKADANRKQFGMQVVQALAQTAMAALNAYTSTLAIPIVGPALAPAAAALALATGMVQVANIKKQQQAAEAQGYMEGGFTRRGARDEVAGVVHAGEWVAPQTLVNNPQARPLIDALEYARRTNTVGSLRPADVSRSITAPIIAASVNSSTQSQQPAPTVVVEQNAEYAEAMARLVARLDEPFVTVNTVTGDTGIKQAQDEYARLMSNKSPKRLHK